MSKRGIVTSAVTKEQRLAAYTLSNSVKISNDIETALIVNKLSDVTEKDQESFDYIIEMPYGSFYDLRSNDWQLYWTTPFESTIYIHPFSLVNVNLDSVFNYFEYSYDVGFPTMQHRINGKVAKLSDDVYNTMGLTKVNSNMFYFNKSDNALKYFKMCDPLFQNWRDAQAKLITEKQYIRKYYDSDLMHTLVCYGVDEPADYFCDIKLLNLYDMQIETNLMKEKKLIERSWSEKLNYWVTPNSNIKIQNYNISGILTYHDYEFLTGEIYDHYRITHKKQHAALG